MNRLKNTLKAALRDGKPQIGLWLSLGDSYSAEICAGAGFDWLLIDEEHAPNDIRSTLRQLQAVAAYPVTAAVRPVIGDVHVIKRMLDIGAQTLIIPMVETAEQAGQMVAAVRYPPDGVRGVASALVRASRWNSVTDYVHNASDEICLILQIESAAGLANVASIAAVDGVDGIFIGPADLSASLGHLGDPMHEDVQVAVKSAVAQVLAAGKAAGIMTFQESQARLWLSLGCTLVAVGSDATLLAHGARALAASSASLSR
jgi:4-hydroxy-2-oxoheptanedioate aldolase